MRTATASSLTAGVMPWLNLANGCGEAWFANPETAVFYPPAWLHMVASPEWALALEIALHLAWLSLGAGSAGRHLGAGPFGRSIAEVVAWSAGPMIFTAGVLNNLETLAWVPWMVLAARVNRDTGHPSGGPDHRSRVARWRTADVGDGGRSDTLAARSRIERPPVCFSGRCWLRSRWCPLCSGCWGAIGDLWRPRGFFMEPFPQRIGAVFWCRVCP